MSQLRMQAKIDELKGGADAGSSPARRTTRNAGPATANSGSPGGLGCSPDELAAAHAATAAARERTAQLEADLQRRQESYLRRERAYKVHIEEMEEELEAARADRGACLEKDPKMSEIRGMHARILSNVGQVQGRTSRILQEQERDLLRAFRARLFDVQSELEKEKNKSDDGASAWIEKARQLEAEVDWAKEIADRLDRVNQALGKENTRLQNQFKTQEGDREFLIKQLVAVKKDNARLREELSTAAAAAAAANKEGEPGSPHHHHSPSHHRGGHGSEAAGDADSRYKEIVKRLKRLLEVERRNLRAVRSQYQRDLQRRTELELFLRQCVEDVRTELAAQRRAKEEEEDAAAAADNAGAEAEHTMGLHDFTAEDRERVMELLLSQERVVALLYSKQTGASFVAGAAEPADGGGGSAGKIEAQLEAELDRQHGAAGGGLEAARSLGT